MQLAIVSSFGEENHLLNEIVDDHVGHIYHIYSSDWPENNPQSGFQVPNFTSDAPVGLKSERLLSPYQIQIAIMQTPRNQSVTARPTKWESYYEASIPKTTDCICTDLTILSSYLFSFTKGELL